MEIKINYSCNFSIAEDGLKINDIIAIIYSIMKDALKVISMQLYRQLEDAFYLTHLGPIQQGKRRKVPRVILFKMPPNVGRLTTSPTMAFTPNQEDFRSDGV